MRLVPPAAGAAEGSAASRYRAAVTVTPLAPSRPGVARVASPPPLSIADEGRVAQLEKELEAQRHYASRLEAALSEATDSMAGGAAVGQASDLYGGGGGGGDGSAANLDVNVSEGDDGFSVSVDAPAFSASPTRRPSGDAVEKLQRQVAEARAALEAGVASQEEEEARLVAELDFGCRS